MLQRTWFIARNGGLKDKNTGSAIESKSEGMNGKFQKQGFVKNGKS